jgi:ubiquitin C
VEQVKAKIQDKEGIPITRQKLVFSGKHVEDMSTLSYCGVENKCTLFLVQFVPRVSVQVTIMSLAGLVITTLDVELSDTVESVKAQIYAKTGLTQDRLAFESKELEDGQTLGDCNVQNESIIYYLLPRSRAGKESPASSSTSSS